MDRLVFPHILLLVHQSLANHQYVHVIVELDPAPRKLTVLLLLKDRQGRISKAEIRLSGMQD